MKKRSVWIGFDPREIDAFIVAKSSAEKQLIAPIPVRGIALSHLRDLGLYYRPTSTKNGRLWDDISEAPMSTEFAISRFLTPYLAGKGLALFMDADMLVRGNLDRLFGLIDPRYAVTVVKHQFDPPQGIKMDGQIQTRYARKNWSSVMVFNCEHPANQALTVDLINKVPGRDLHRFCWLEDDQIGEIGAEWNYLIGHTEGIVDPSIVHFTDGIPSMAGYENCEFADEWRHALYRWVL